MLSPKQQRFVAEYLKDSNATQAAIRAGYSVKTAGSQGGRLLKNVEVSQAVKARVEKVGMSADEVLQGLAAIAQFGEKDSDRVAAYALLGKHHKLFTEKHEVDSRNLPDGVVILPPESD